MWNSECGIHAHTMINNKVNVKYDNLHSMLKMFVKNKVTFHSYLMDDMELVDAEDQLNENDHEIFDEELGSDDGHDIAQRFGQFGSA